MNLKQLDSKAVSLHQKIRKTGRTLTGYYWDLYHVLMNIKASLPHGEYEKHCDHLGITQPMRSYCYQIGETYKHKKDCEHLGIRDAINERTTSYHGKQQTKHKKPIMATAHDPINEDIEEIELPITEPPNIKEKKAVKEFVVKVGKERAIELLRLLERGSL